MSEPGMAGNVESWLARKHHSRSHDRLLSWVEPRWLVAIDSNAVARMVTKYFFSLGPAFPTITVRSSSLAYPPTSTPASVTNTSPLRILRLEKTACGTADPGPTCPRQPTTTGERPHFSWRYLAPSFFIIPVNAS